MGGQGCCGQCVVGQESEHASVSAGSGIRMLQSLQDFIFGNPLPAIAFSVFQKIEIIKIFVSFLQIVKINYRFEKLASVLIPAAFVLPM